MHIFGVFLLCCSKSVIRAKRVSNCYMQEKKNWPFVCPDVRLILVLVLGRQIVCGQKTVYLCLSRSYQQPVQQYKHHVVRSIARGRSFHPWAGRLRFSGEAHPGPATLTQSSSPWTHTSDDSFICQLSLVVTTATLYIFYFGFLLERSEFLIATSKKKSVLCACVRLILVLVGKKIVRVFD